ncbi:aspartate-semialdehyde dehydrogenase [Gilvimarinus sp. F26214L]|uniref:aspartate-semialdehyde dehydrogenase n=1 Tax=Gilvimarinus sp. DZF01 TaxID=3461371 RepID=UPI0040452C03
MSCNIAIVGANSAVGEVLLQVIDELKLPIDRLHILAPNPEDEEQVVRNRKPLPTERLGDFDFSTVRLVFFVDDQALSADFAARASEAGAFVVDCSAQFRSAEDVPLVVPEVNGELLEALQPGALVASPSPASVFLSLVLKPLVAVANLTRVGVCSMHPVSAQGRGGVDELAGQTARLLNGLGADAEVFPKQVAFNLLPQTSALSANGYSAEEIDLLTETRRVLDLPDLPLNPTCVQAPVFYAHSEAISVEADRPLPAGEVSALLSRAPGLKLNRKNDGGPTPVQDATGENLLMVGRVRQALDNEREVNLWCVGDHLRKGAALNAVQIAEILLKTHL